MVWRCLGRIEAMRRMAGRKPTSSMRSASSSTRMRSARKSTILRSRKSSRRPGVATMRRAPRRSAAICLPFGEAADHDGRRRKLTSAQQRQTASATCMASSRVGTSTKRRNSRRFFAQKLFDDGNQERECLAGSGLGGRENVVAFEGLRNRGGLHGHGRHEARGHSRSLK